MDGDVKWKIQNKNPLSFEDVKVWAAKAQHGFPPADAYFKDLQYENLSMFIKG